MAKARHRSTAGRVDIVLAGLIADSDALSGRGDRIAAVELAMDDVGHDAFNRFLDRFFVVRT